MMDSPEARPVAGVPWLFGVQGLGLLAFITAVAATFLATDVTYLAGALLLVGLGAHGWARLAFVRITYERKPSGRRAFRGDELMLDSTLSNPRILPLPWVEVWELLPAALQPEGQIERSHSQPDRRWVSRGLAVWPYQRLRWKRRLFCDRRGVYQLGPIHVRSGDPFGFFERERVYADKEEVMIYPRVVTLRRLALSMHHPSLDAVSPVSPVTDPTRTATIRDYRPDDPRRMIHWPTTARRGSLQVRVLEPTTSLHVTMLLDVRGFTFGIYQGELLELTLSAIASIAVFLQSQSAPIALVANGDPPLVIPPSASFPHLQQVLEALARLRPTSGPSLMPWALDVLPRGNTVILAASEVSPDLGQHIARLEDYGFRVLLLLASRDRLPFLIRPGTINLTPGCDLTARLEGAA